MKRSTRALAYIAAVMLLFSVLFSVCFLAQNASHHCGSDCCPICQQLEACESLLSTVAVAAVAVMAAFIVPTLSEAISRSLSKKVSVLTLVSLKVKLSN